MLNLRVRFTFALAFVFLLTLGAHAAPRSRHPQAKSKKKSPAAAAATPTPQSKNLEQLCRGLKLKNAAASYTKLSAIANQKGSGVTGMRAALALGYYDLGKDHYAQAAQWFSRATNDPLLHDYGLLYGAQANIELNKNAEALAQLQQYRRENPDSVLMDQAVQSLATAAIS